MSLKENYLKRWADYLYPVFAAISLLMCSYGQALAQVNFTSSDLPILVIETNLGQDIPDEPKIGAQMRLINRPNGEKNLVTDPGHDYDGVVGIELRGSSSANFPKKGFGFETRFEDGSNNNVQLLGMPAENDWVLHGPYSDKSLMRNALAYIFAGEIMSYAPRVRHVEMVINGQYQGVYLLTEKIKRDKNRVDISNLTPADIDGDQLTGGYIIKVDKYTGNSRGWSSEFPYPQDNRSHDYIYHYPKFENMANEQKQYIQTFIFEFETLMSSPDYADPVDGYSKWIDEDTFVDFYMINEISKNVDGYRLSTFLYKDRDSIDTRMKLGPVWDFNLGFGNADYCEGFRTSGWSHDFNNVCPGDGFKIPFYWDRLLADNAFREKIKNRWIDLRQGNFSDEALMAKVDSLANLLDESQQRNFIQWPILGEYVWPNPTVNNTYGQEVAYLKDWLLERVHWMDIRIDTFVSTTSVVAAAYSLYPNPTSDQINFTLPPSLNRTIDLDIFDLTGRIVMQRTFEIADLRKQITDIDVNALSQGTYFYALSRDGTVVKNGMLQRL